MRLSGKHIHELREQIMPDVCSLRGALAGIQIDRQFAEFFEEIAEKSTLVAKSPQIMKEAMSARASFLNKNKTRLRNSIRQAKRAQRRLCKLGDGACCVRGARRLCAGSDDDEASSSRTTTSEDMSSTTTEANMWRHNVTMT